MKTDVFFPQETYSNDENIWKSEWGGDMFFSHGSIHTQSIHILLNPSLNCIVKIFTRIKLEESSGSM